MKNIKVDNHQFISRLIYANNALFLQTWDAPETMDKIMEQNRASKKLLTVNPGVTSETREKEIALTTKRNKPRLRIVKGKVNKSRIGLTIALIKPMTAVAIAATVNPLMVIPGIK